MYPIALTLGRSVSPAAVEPLVKSHSEKPKVWSLNFVACWLRGILQQDVIKLRVLRPNVFTKSHAWSLNTFKIDKWWIWRILRTLLYWIKYQKNKGCCFHIIGSNQTQYELLMRILFLSMPNYIVEGLCLTQSVVEGRAWMSNYVEC